MRIVDNAPRAGVRVDRRRPGVRRGGRGRRDEEEEEEDEDEEEDDAPPPPRFPASRGKAPAAPDPAEDAYEDEEDEEDEEDVSTTTPPWTTFFDGWKDERPRAVRDPRRAQAPGGQGEEEAFRQELARHGIKAPADLSKEYGAAELLDRHMLDKEALLAANPAFKMFLGAAQGASVPRGSLGRGRSKKPRRTRKRVTEGEAERKLGEANLLYTQGESHYQRAVELLFEVIRLSPNTPDPWHTLATIHEELGDERKALDFLMIAVQLTPKDLHRGSASPTGHERSGPAVRADVFPQGAPAEPRG